MQRSPHSSAHSKLPNKPLLVREGLGRRVAHGVKSTLTKRSKVVYSKILMGGQTIPVGILPSSHDANTGLRYSNINNSSNSNANAVD